MNWCWSIEPPQTTKSAVGRSPGAKSRTTCLRKGSKVLIVNNARLPFSKKREQLDVSLPDLRGFGWQQGAGNAVPCPSTPPAPSALPPVERTGGSPERYEQSAGCGTSGS